MHTYTPALCYNFTMLFAPGKKRGKAVLMPFQLAVLVGIAITYTVVGGDNLDAFVASVAPWTAGGKWGYYLMFGGLQLLLSMVR
jgi:hypothetical protein